MDILSSGFPVPLIFLWQRPIKNFFTHSYAFPNTFILLWNTKWDILNVHTALIHTVIKSYNMASEDLEYSMSRMVLCFLLELVWKRAAEHSSKYHLFSSMKKRMSLEHHEVYKLQLILPIWLNCICFLVWVFLFQDFYRMIYHCINYVNVIKVLFII